MKISSDFKPQNNLNQKNNAIKAYEEIAEGMEANFTSHLLAEMRKSVPQETPDSSAMSYYNSLMDYERAQLMAKSDTGLGVKKIILDQIVPHNLKHLQNKPYVRESSPVRTNESMKENTHE